jgi:hypothetical protein
VIQSGFTKLFSSLVTSTIWDQPPTICKLWITLLALSDKDGYVAGSIPGLAHQARLTIDECKQGLDVLQSPDEYSRTPDHDGRRIQAVDGGWLILNRTRYRDQNWEEDRRERDRIRQQRCRGRKGKGVTRDSVTKCDSHVTGVTGHILSEKKEKEQKKTTTTTTVEPQSLPTTSSRREKRLLRTRTAVLSAYPQAVSRTVNHILSIWPSNHPNGERIRPDLAALASRVDQILRDNEDADSELLIKAAETYLAEQRRFYRAPQFFFGPGNGTEAPWVAYARMIVHQTSKDQPSPEATAGGGQ